LREFAETLRTLGARRFRDEYGAPALVGVGLIGELAAQKEDPRHTHAMKGTTEYIPVQSLIDRVWLIRRTNYTRKDSYITVGSKSDCDVVIPEYTVSSRHCAFTMYGKLKVDDLGSLNGTNINLKKLERRELVEVPDGCSMTMARLVFACFTANGFVAHLRTNVA